MTTFFTCPGCGRKIKFSELSKLSCCPGLLEHKCNIRFDHSKSSGFDESKPTGELITRTVGTGLKVSPPPQN